MKLGSLFDGSGGFPLAGVLHGVEPVWASEIEPYPIRVTTARFPAMKHLGDVTKIDGAAIEPVDIITFGSPCQDLSVAGKQAGLHKGERSNLFFEAIRIIKEMRRSTDGIYPRIAIWENVPGAYSSNKGEDFRAVLQAFCTVKDETADVPRPAAGKWNPAGAIVGNGWSVAWRTFDAQYWGVPQRRKRIYLIADFGSERAGEILFEPEGLRGDSAESGKAGEGTADNAEGSAGRGGGAIVFKERAGCPGGGKGILCGDKPFTLSTLTDQAVCYAIDQQGGKGVRAYDIGEARLRNPQEYIELSPTLTQRCGTGGNNTPAVCYVLQGNGIDRADTAGCNGAGWRESYPIDSNPTDSRFKFCEDGVCPTVPARMGTGGNQGPMVLEAYSAGNGQLHQALECEKARPLDCMHDQQIVLHPSKPPRRYIIRRLTPLECCRLQGFPDWWEDGVQGSDSARYKMWGNGLALPNAAHVVGCAVKLIKETQT